MLNDVFASLLKSEFVQSTKNTDLLSNLNFLVTSSAQSRSTFLLLSLSKLTAALAAMVIVMAAAVAAASVVVPAALAAATVPQTRGRAKTT